MKPNRLILSVFLAVACIAGMATLVSLTGCGASPAPQPAPDPTSVTGSTTPTGSTTNTGTSNVSADIEASLPLVRTGAAVATGAVLDFAVKQDSTRTRLANEMYSAASSVYSLTGGAFPTPEQFQSNVLAFGGSQVDASYAQFASAIGALYAAYYPKLITGDTKTGSDLLNAIAGGIEDATASYVATPIAPTASTGTSTFYRLGPSPLLRGWSTGDVATDEQGL